MQTFTKRFVLGLCLVLLAIAVVSCGGPEEKKMKFFNKGKALYEAGDFVKARLEFKNAIQIDPNFAEAYYMLGMVEFQEKNWRQAFGALSKAVELNPDHLDAEVALGRILLAAKQNARAQEKAHQVQLPHQDDRG